VRIQFDEEVLLLLNDKLRDLREWIPSTTLSNIVNNELKQQLKK